MNLALPVLGVAVAAYLIWLTVRIVNQRERWAIRLGLVTVAVFLPLGAMVLLYPAVSTPKEVPRRMQCRSNLRQIGFALHSYHDEYGCLPPAYIADETGRPMHSWRVLILPWLDQQSLYTQYRFDEPWDGPHNRKLADSIVPVYNCPSDEHGGSKTGTLTMTNYVAVVGPETAWPEQGAMTIDDFTDGTSNTILLVEVANSGIHWMEPRDLHVLQMTPVLNAKSGQGISSRHPGGANVLLGDGTVRFVPARLTSDELRAWLTPAAGDSSTGF